MSNRTVKLSVFTSCTTPHCDLDVLHSETGKFITAGAFSIWRRRAPLPNSLAERFTKQPALDLRHFSRRRPGGSRRTSASCRSYCASHEIKKRGRPSEAALSRQPIPKPPNGTLTSYGELCSRKDQPDKAV